MLELRIVSVQIDKKIGMIHKDFIVQSKKETNNTVLPYKQNNKCNKSLKVQKIVGN